MKIKTILNATLIAAMLITGCSKSGPSKDEKPASVSMETPVTVNDVSYIAVDVQEATEYNGKKTENKFVVVTVSAKNNGKKEARVYSELFYLIDGGGREFKGDVFRDSGGDKGYFGYADAIQPGLKKSGRVGFEVPADASGFKLAISDSMIDAGGAKYTYITLK